MWCANCGKELPDNAAFCGACGAQVAGAEASTTFMDESANGAADGAGIPMTGGNGGKKKGSGKKKGLIAALAAVLVVVLVVVFAGESLANFFHKTFSSPESYFRYVVEKNAESGIDEIGDFYGDFLDRVDDNEYGFNLKFKGELSDTVKTMLGSQVPMLSEMKSVDMEATAGIEEDVYNFEFSAGLNDATAATVQGTVKLKEKKGYLRIPELSKSYIDFSDALVELEGETTNTNMASVKKVLPKTSMVTDLLDRYLNVVCEQVEDVEKSSEKLSVGEASGTYTALTTKLDGKFLYRVAEETLETLEDDEDVKEFLKALEKEYGEFKVSDLWDNIDEARKELKENKDEIEEMDVKIPLTIYVNGGGDLVGAELEAEGMNLSYLALEDGANVGYAVDISYDGKSVAEVTVSGKKKGDRFNGTMSCKCDPSLFGLSSSGETEELFTATYTDWDMESAKDGQLNGTIELKSEYVAALKGYSIKLTCKSTDKTSDFTGKVMAGKDELGSISIGFKQDVKLETLNPGDEKVYTTDQLEDYMAELDLDTFVSNYMKKAGITWDENTMGNLFGSLMGAGQSYDDYDADDYGDYDLGDYDLDDYDTDDYGDCDFDDLYDGLY